ncbi:MAG: carbohydrate ABC transporter permease [Chloroflexi bacterium]|nr:carbohydrate ABC transporter permease [Chloroflexota bacterium]MCI0579441.1 carbohydrate ABC transporter permease [Chloroflexota bacterium]MCI0644988.1 carbohydrate ABC transporter permease [Chloroflexota bacterium]MCI0732178.1 carbohydrate ABC transporter permease [Chloroflexota bacterium]
MFLLRFWLKRILVYVLVILFCLFSAFPFLIMLINAFKQDIDIYRPQNNPFLYNVPPTLDNLRLLFQETNYTTFLRNSLFVGVLVVIITLVVSIPAAYSLARLAGRWGERAGIAIFMVYLVPPTLLFIPLFRIVTLLNLNNSLWSLVVVYPTISIPFCTWLLMGFFKSIPRDLEEAAMVDGYSRLMAFLKVVMPLSLSGVIAVIVFTFTLTLHEFVYALTFISSSQFRTISVGVPIELVRGDVFFWQSLLAAAVIVAIPVGVVYNMFLDRLVAGFTMGAVKG